jgi:hypothetical protein
MSWGPPFWVFFHALAANLVNDTYIRVKDKLMYHFKNLCSTLPCPDCAEHATAYLAKCPTPPTVDDFANFLWKFHNTVNIRTRKRILSLEQLNMYKNAPIFHLYKCFKQSYTKTTYNPKMIIHNMQKQQNINAFHEWSMKHLFTIKVG